jgi:hypothetical protein
LVPTIKPSIVPPVQTINGSNHQTISGSNQFKPGSIGETGQLSPGLNQYGSNLVPTGAIVGHNMV